MGKTIAQKIFESHLVDSPFENTYIINVYFKKHIIGTNFAKIIVKPYKLKYTDNKNKCIHIETKLYEGVEV